MNSAVGFQSYWSLVWLLTDQFSLCHGVPTHKELITVLASICKVLWDKLIKRAMEELAFKIYSLLSKVCEPYRSKLWSVVFGKSSQELQHRKLCCKNALLFYKWWKTHTSFLVPQNLGRSQQHPWEQGHIHFQQPSALIWRCHLWPESRPLLPLFLLHVRVHNRAISCYPSDCGPCVCKWRVNLIISVAFYQANSGPVVESFLV